MRQILFLVPLISTLWGNVAGQERRPYLPKPKLTPGATVGLAKDKLCGPRQAHLVGHIPVARKRQVFDRYGIGANSPGGYNVDHLIPVRLGGANSVDNLWPQPLSGEWSYHIKNRLERRLRKLVCSGALDLKTAQEEIASDWVQAYKKYMGTK